MQAEAEPIPDRVLPSLTGLIVIVPDEGTIAPLLVQLLQQQGASPVLLQSEQDIAAQLTGWRQQYGVVRGVIHLAGLSSPGLAQSLTEWRTKAQAHGKDLFQLLQLCREDLQAVPQGRILSVSALGGYFGRQTITPGSWATAGAAVGLLKTVVTEWPTVIAKAMDLDLSLVPETLAQQIMQELHLPGGRLEVGYPQGQRTIFRTVTTSLFETNAGWQPTAESVLLATGGARGITAELVADLAPSGLRLIVTGQSPEPLPEDEVTRSLTAVADLRKVLLQQAIAQGQKPTPVVIEQQVQKLLRARATRENLDRFRSLGANVEYLAVDVRDEAAFGGLIQQVYDRYGRLDAVLHGAGLIEDKLIADKTSESFDRVFDTKVDSTYILSRYLRPESLKLIVFFTSVAGRYGNRGQSDYAAANETVNRLAWQLHQQWQGTRVLSVNWGPWDTTGMASDDVKRQFRERGIIPIPLAAGRQFFTAELRHGTRAEVEVIAGAGPWEAYEAEQGQVLTATEAVAAQSAASPFLLLSQAPQLQPDSTITLTQTLTLAQMPALADHCLDGKPVMPATGALAWMAEFAQAGWPEWTVAEVCDLRVFRGLIVASEAGLTVQLRAKASQHADAESLEVRVEILDAQGKLPYYRAAIVLRPALEEAEATWIPELTKAVAVQPAEAYQKYLFHGPDFELLTAISTSVEGIDAQVKPSVQKRWQPTAAATTPWIFDPGMVDTAPQLAIVWARLQHDTTALPSRIGRAVRYRTMDWTRSYRVAFRIVQADVHSLTYDAWFLNEQDEVCFALYGVEGTCNAALNRLGA
jgi:NAD(P)-dependent dehydrogenase (short-subunit alcohol dehydrogenase family)